MKIRLAHNINTFDGGMEIGPEEIGGKMGMERLRKLTQEGIVIADEIFKRCPEIKQVTFDTMTDEERELIAQATKGGPT